MKVNNLPMKNSGKLQGYPKNKWLIVVDIPSFSGLKNAYGGFLFAGGYPNKSSV